MWVEHPRAPDKRRETFGLRRRTVAIPVATAVAAVAVTIAVAVAVTVAVAVAVTVAVLFLLAVLVLLAPSLGTSLAPSLACGLSVIFLLLCALLKQLVHVHVRHLSTERERLDRGTRAAVATRQGGKSGRVHRLLTRYASSSGTLRMYTPDPT